MDINIRFHTALGNVNFQTSNDYSKAGDQENLDNLFLLFGMGLPWKTFDRFCESLKLTPEQTENFRKLNSDTWNKYRELILMNKKNVGWEG